MRDIRLIFSYIKGKWAYMTTHVVAHLLSVVFNLVSLAMLVPFLKLLFNKESLITQNPGFEWSAKGIESYFLYHLSNIIVSHDNDLVWGLLFIIAVIIIATFFKNLCIYIAKYIINPLRNNVVRQIRGQLYGKILHLPIAYFSEERKGDIISRMSNDVTDIEQSIVSVMNLIFSAPITVLFYITVMFLISPTLCLFLVVLLPIAGFIIGRMSKRLKKQSTQSQEYAGNILSLIDETLGGLRIIKAFRAEGQQAEQFDKENTSLYNMLNSIALRRELASPLSEFLGVCVLGIVLWFGGKMVIGDSKEITESSFILFVVIFTQLLDPLKKLSQLFYNVARGKAAFERVDKILFAQNPIVDALEAKPVQSFEHNIEFKGVHFSYEGVPILQDINLNIVKGKTIAVVGASGSGKSTLVDLVPRFHEVDQGEILIDGINIKEYKLNDLRGLMGIVSQEAILFNDSIKNNICLGSARQEEKRIIESAEIAHAASFIEQKEQGYDTLIGDRGMKLSGGEKQRLTIARAVYKNPPILILDEATSSLDTVSEKMVQDAIENLMQHRTSIVIAHRLSTIKHADEIIVLDKGRIIERGKHDELIELNGVYRELVALQNIE